MRYAVRLSSASRPSRKGAPDFVNEWVNWGAGTRASQYLVLGAKTRAVLDGRFSPSVDDVQAVSRATLRHRILVGYRAEAEGVSVEAVIDRLLEAVKPPAA